jgi:hypothetical protein
VVHAKLEDMTMEEMRLAKIVATNVKAVKNPLIIV